MVVTYIAFTRIVTEWRAKLQRQMNEVDNQAIARAVDSLLNYETVKYFGAEEREARRYWPCGQQFADAGKERDVARLAERRPVADHQPDDGGRDGLYRLGLEPRRFTHGDVVLVNTLLAQLFRPLDMLGWVYRRSARA
jgi:ATP-binding cassette subfamily B protein